MLLKLPAYTPITKPVPVLKPPPVKTVVKTAVPTTTNKIPTTTPITGASTPFSGVPGNANASTADVASNFQDYLDAIQADPVYASALASFNQQSQASRSALASQIGQLVTQGGYDITGALSSDPTLASYAGDITPTIAAAAANNPLSQKAQIDQGYNQNLSDLAYEMAARGTVGSGAATAGASGLLQQTQVAHQNAQQQLIDAIRGGVSSYLSTLTTGQQGLSDTMGTVAARLAQQPTGPLDIGDTQPDPTPQPSTPPTTTTNQPGVYWTVDGVKRLAQSPAQMASLLGATGTSYATWAKNHPSAAATLALMG